MELFSAHQGHLQLRGSARGVGRIKRAGRFVGPLLSCAAVLIHAAHARGEKVPTTNPSGLSSRAVIAPADEPGQRMRISGTVYAADGKTPVEGVVIYVYHTNAQGRYDMRPGEHPDAPQFRLQAWMKTGADGRYEFDTIKPGSYPSGTEPAHIHSALTPPGGEPDWSGDYLFEGDPKIEQRHLRNSSVLTLRPGDDGVLVGTRDFVIKRK